MKEFTDLKEAKPAKVQGSREKGQRSGREWQGVIPHLNLLQTEKLGSSPSEYTLHLVLLERTSYPTISAGLRRSD